MPTDPRRLETTHGLGLADDTRPSQPRSRDVNESDSDPLRVAKAPPGVDVPVEAKRTGHSKTYRKTARRLRGAARWFSIGYALALVIGEFVTHVLEGTPFDVDVVYLLAAIFIAISLVVDRIARPGRLRMEQLVLLGLIYQVVASLGISLGMHVNPVPEGTAVWGISWICVWIVMFPLVVRATPVKTTLAAFVSASMGPLSLAFWILVDRFPAPSASTMVSMFWPPFLCAGLASLGSQIIFHMRKDLERARLMGSYRLEEKLGQGGMGEVWRARHEMLIRPAAIKLVRTGALGGDGTRATLRRFEREAQATAWLSSPHTIRLFDFGTTRDGTLYYVMELLDGLDLQSLVHRYGPVPAERAVHFVKQVCESLAEAHDHGLIHRDIKPANIYACRIGTKQDFVKVLDFGLVKPGSVDATTLTGGSVAGTPAYMAPETAMGEEIDLRSDLYSLGCVLYWLMTGSLVFDADSAVQMAVKHVREEPCAPSRRTTMPIPEALDDVVLACLAKDPASRPADARDLAARIEKIDLASTWTEDRAHEWWQIHLPRGDHAGIRREP